MQKTFESFQESAPLSVILDGIEKSPFNQPHFIILNTQEELAGILSLSDLKPHLGKLGAEANVLHAADPMTHGVATIPADSNLEEAFKIFEKSAVSCLPVTDPANSKKVVGILRKDDLFRIYQERIEKSQTLSSS